MEFEDRYFDAERAAKQLGCHPETVKRYIRAGDLPATKIANKWFIEAATLYQFGSSYDPRVGRPPKRLL